ncbi:MAG: glycosyltransferase [Methanomassiliicoccaceae archaeon]|nr:glycosyltransferase [Methanomassiliicoccaceae archaeon]
MSPVVIMKRSVAISGSNGADAYSECVRNALVSHDIPYETEEILLDTKTGYLRCLKEGFIRPFLGIIRRRKKKDEYVYHAVDELVCLLFPLVKGKKVVTFHHLLRDTDKDMKASLLWHVSAKIAIRRSDIIIAISPQTRDDLVYRYHVREDKIVTVLHTIPPEFITLENTERERAVGCVSTLIRRKNVDALIRSFSSLTKMDRMSDVRLRICGKGPEKEALEKLAASLGISDRVEFLSDLSMDELVRFYNSVTVLANPSLHEGFGRITLEAQRCSTPVVYFREADIPPEVTKFAVPCSDEEEMAEKMYDLFTDAEMREGIVRDGKEYADGIGHGFSDETAAVFLKLMDGTG